MKPPPRPAAKPNAEAAFCDDAQRWLFQAAQTLGLPTADARAFARNGALSVPGMSVQLSLWQALPVPQWIALGVLPRPGGLNAEGWSELLLHANCAVSAMSPCSLALNEAGDGLLVQRLASRPDSTAPRLSDELAHLLALGESLVAGATALFTGVTGTSTLKPVAPSPLADALQSVSTAMNHTWHRPLLTQALQRLGIAAPPDAQMQTVGVIQANGRAFEVIADADQQHLLISTALDTALTRHRQRESALHANLHLLLLTHCAVVLTPHGPALQARWSSRALDGAAFADWLLDFGQLADSFTPAPSPAATAPRNPAWT